MEIIMEINWDIIIAVVIGWIMGSMPMIINIIRDK